MSKEDTKNMPVATFRALNLSVALWENKDKEGENVWFTTSAIQRSYKDKKGDWQTTGSLQRNDIPVAITLLSRAYEWMLKGKDESDNRD